jgi:ECF transporter S component (folate family)
MRFYFDSIHSSANELKKPSSLTGAAMLTALNVILFLFFSIQITTFIRFSFSFLPLAASGALFGPVVGAIVGGVGDLLNFLIKPTGAFFPGFTFNAILTGAIYGLLLYRKPVTLLRVFVTKLIITVVVELFFGTLWLSMMYGEGFLAVFPARAVKNLILLPVETGLLFGMLKVMERFRVFRKAK